jgi:ribonuclease P protein component
MLQDSMLSQDNRLRKMRDFSLIIKHGQWINGRFLDIKYLELAKNQKFFPKKEDLESFKKQLKLAISVGLKISKSAVKRNRIKRQARETIRLLIKDSVLQQGYYVLVVAKKGVLDQDYAKISEEINFLFNRAHIIKL